MQPENSSPSTHPLAWDMPLQPEFPHGNFGTNFTLTALYYLAD